MKQKLLYILTLVLFAAAAPAQAQTFEGLLEKLKNHPQVDAILAESERQGELAEGELGLPDPTVSLGVNNLPTDSFAFDTERMTSKVIEFNQEIPSYSLRKARAGMREAESDKQRLMAAYAEAQLKELGFNVEDTVAAALQYRNQLKDEADNPQPTTSGVVGIYRLGNQKRHWS